MRKFKFNFCNLLLCAALLCGVLLHTESLSVYAKESAKETISEETKEEALSEKVMKITTVEEFLAFSENCRLDSYSQGLTVVLEADLNLEGVVFEGIPIFYGTFEGGGYRISGLVIENEGSIQGLFRYLGEGAVLRDLSVSGEISPGGSGSRVGSLAGSNAGKIENCNFYGLVTGVDSIGGLVGVNEMTGIIEDCYVDGTIHGSHFVGGLAGENYGVIRNCNNFTEINTTVSQNSVEISDITIDSLVDSESAVTVTDIGGISGTNSGVLRNCSNYGTIGYRQIGYNIGGIAGTQMGYITNCNNFAEVFGRKEVGGIVGQIEPGTNMNFEKDTVQTLAGQLDTMASLTEKASANAQNSAAGISDQMDVLGKQVEEARKAADALAGEYEDGYRDPDSIVAMQNGLSGNLADISKTLNDMTAEGETASSTTAKDLQAISKQMSAISNTVEYASEGFGASIKDVSDEDTEGNTICKVENCTNKGAVQGDLNTGGVVGAIALENDADQGDGLEISGETSLNFEYELRAVVLSCKNQGEVHAKKQNVGGIVGWMELGLVKDGQNAGTIDAPDADYVGGIAGQARGFIRQCSAKCVLSGKIYVGGIAGSGMTVTDCRAMVQITDALEKQGIILGYVQDVSDDEEATVENNYYLSVGSDIGGVDGISYAGCAQALDNKAFYSLENLPEMFETLMVRFMVEDSIEKSLSVDYGDTLQVGDMPVVPEKEGYIGTWDIPEDVDLSYILFDTTITAVYTPLISTLQSDVTNEAGRPILLAQGNFVGDKEVLITVSEHLPVVEQGAKILEVWDFVVPESDKQISLRFRPSQTIAENQQLLVRDAAGYWYNRDFSVDGSYVVFGVNNGDNAFCLVDVPIDYTPTYLTILAVLVVLLIILAVHRKRVHKQENPKKIKK